jgi:hypothetical protein
MIVSKRTYVFAVVLLLLINGFTCLLLLPYIQQTANSHVNAGPGIAILYYIIGTILLLVSIRWYIRMNNVTLFVLHLLIVATFIRWGYILSSIYCMKCAIME